MLTRLAPQRGRATIFSSGWENLHFVDPISAGRRFAMPAFFVTNAASAREGEGDLRGAVGRQVRGSKSYRAIRDDRLVRANRCRVSPNSNFPFPAA